MLRTLLSSSLCFLATTLVAQGASATRSAEIYTSKGYSYGRFEARLRFAAGDGVVSSFFLWKDGSEKAGTFWNELDYEKLGADCHIETNAYYGNPAAVHSQHNAVDADPCGGFHTYAYEWTPEYIAWFLDDVEIRRETGAAATAYADNTPNGMQIRFNIWPGNASFGGNFSPSILPVHQYVDWMQYSSYADGAFTVEWKEEFEGESLPLGWYPGDWGSPKNLSTHSPDNVNVLDGYLVLSLTADDATGPDGADPEGMGTGTGGTTGTSPPPGGGDDGGCSVAVSRSSHTGALFAVLGLGTVASLSRRRRPKTAPRR
jgi:endo-1,3-1,4-beta-glycanase ExoK